MSEDIEDVLIFLMMVTLIDNLLIFLIVPTLLIFVALWLWDIYKDWKAGYIGKKYRKTGSPDY